MKVRSACGTVCRVEVLALVVVCGVVVVFGIFGSVGVVVVGGGVGCG